jgi:hypothetical protein
MTDAPPDAGRERGPRRPVVTGRDVAGAGMLMLSANLLCAAVAAGLGALVGAVVPLAVAGFLVGFFVGIYVVAKRFREI